MTLLEFLDQTPPFVTRGRATLSGKGKVTQRRSVKMLVKASGIPSRTIEALSYRATWGNEKLKTISAFAAACGVDLIYRKPAYEWWRAHGKHQFSHMTKRQRKKMDEAARAWKKLYP